jgi:hypothetical protein
MRSQKNLTSTSLHGVKSQKPLILIDYIGPDTNLDVFPLAHNVHPIIPHLM